MNEDPCAHLALPMPGEEFDDAVVVASGWVSDTCETAECWCAGTSIGVLLLHPDQPGEFYSIAEYRRASGGWEQTASQVHANIVPAARHFDETFGFWGEA